MIQWVATYRICGLTCRHDRRTGIFRLADQGDWTAQQCFLPCGRIPKLDCHTTRFVPYPGRRSVGARIAPAHTREGKISPRVPCLEQTLWPRLQQVLNPHCRYAYQIGFCATPALDRPSETVTYSGAAPHFSSTDSLSRDDPCFLRW